MSVLCLALTHHTLAQGLVTSCPPVRRGVVPCIQVGCRRHCSVTVTGEASGQRRGQACRWLPGHCWGLGCAWADGSAVGWVRQFRVWSLCAAQRCRLSHTLTPHPPSLAP